VQYRKVGVKGRPFWGKGETQIGPLCILRAMAVIEILVET